jgi:predicted O-methyltransferase YrrM
MIDKEILEKLIDSKLSNYFTQLEALQSIKNLFPEVIYMPPTRGWAGSPDFLLKLVELVITESPEYVLELGSGVSSIVLGLALNKFSKGQLVTIDHELVFAQKTQKIIYVNNLSGTVDVNFCPLIECQYQDSRWQWYDLSRVQFNHSIDLLVVDGPPRKVQEKSRFLALTALIDKLSPEATIVLDDANRKNEKEVVKDWEVFLKERKIKYDLFIYPEYEKGMAIIKICT